MTPMGLMVLLLLSGQANDGGAVVAMVGHMTGVGVACDEGSPFGAGLVTHRLAELSDSRTAQASPKASSAPAENSAVVLDKVIKRVQEAYKGINTLQADFSQSVLLGATSRPRVDTGKLEMKKGGLMRWDFERPSQRHFISDGKTLWVYNPAEKQVMKTSLRAGASRTALNFLFGLGQVMNDFVPSLGTEKAYQKPGADTLQLLPKESLGTIKKLTILVDRKDGMVREAYLHDPMGTVTHVVFSNMKVNGPIDDTRFKFEVPAGVEVFEPKGF